MGHAIADVSARASMEVALAATIAMAALALSLRTIDSETFRHQDSPL